MNRAWKTKKYTSPIRGKVSSEFDLNEIFCLHRGEPAPPVRPDGVLSDLSMVHISCWCSFKFNYVGDVIWTKGRLREFQVFSFCCFSLQSFSVFISYSPSPPSSSPQPLFSLCYISDNQANHKKRICAVSLALALHTSLCLRLLKHTHTQREPMLNVWECMCPGVNLTKRVSLLLILCSWSMRSVEMIHVKAADSCIIRSLIRGLLPRLAQSRRWGVSRTSADKGRCLVFFQWWINKRIRLWDRLWGPGWTLCVRMWIIYEHCTPTTEEMWRWALRTLMCWSTIISNAVWICFTVSEPPQLGLRGNYLTAPAILRASSCLSSLQRCNYNF